MDRYLQFFHIVKVCGAIMVVFALVSPVRAFDVNGDGKEGLPETIHSLQVVAGMNPSSSPIIYVGPVGTAVENGTALLDALDNIDDSSSTKPYLLKLEPGIYDIENEGLYMKSYVDIEGSGQHTTTITSTHSGANADSASATIIGASSAEIRFLTIENRGGGTHAIAMCNPYVSPAITNITAIASGGLYNRGFHNNNSVPVMNNVTIDLSGETSGAYGVYNSYASAVMNNLRIEISDGNFAFGVNNSNSSPSMTGIAMILSATNSNVGVVNATYSSPTMTDISILCSGGYDDNTGVHNSNYSSPTMFNVSINANGTGSVYGVYNHNYSSPSMAMVTATVTGGTHRFGLYNDYYASPSVSHLTVTSATYGVRNVSASAPIIRDSSITGSTYSIFNDTGTSIKVANSMLDGTRGGSGGYSCVGAYDQAFALLNASCQ